MEEGLRAGQEEREMRVFRILTLVGEDRPGIVDSVSGLLLKREGNIEDSRMASMGGCFTIMSLFSCEEDQLPRIEEGLASWRAEGLQAALHEAADPLERVVPPALPLTLEVTSMDHPGIVKEVVHLLHLFRVNIEAMDTRVTRAPLSGAPLFNLRLEAAVPADEPIARVKAELESLAARLNMDLSFS
jgi:glycine cleavage system transcriptional repressor